MNADPDFVVTKSALVKKDSVEGFKCVVYASHQKKSCDKKKTENNTNNSEDDFNVDKWKHEMMKFSIAGMNPEERREAKKMLAIKLGAKPPKREYINYKKLMEQKKLEKRKQELLAKKQPDDPMAYVNQIQNKKKKQPSLAERRKNNILEAYGKPGQVNTKKKKRRRR